MELKERVALIINPRMETKSAKYRKHLLKMAEDVIQEVYEEQGKQREAIMRAIAESITREFEEKRG